ncbi:thioredoxin-like protein [Arcticibacter tournemirensis]|uniref:Glutaredoxin n=1 Tax=Arcticibacter tournemirensis TaxID=699437 RepID=A0A5M9GRV8_9SPHI|nr:thioredoxin family protein [Arcticibacter tournemirensis]KAA8477502.1 glutaredoxin [Arcticibacter tournemirensis]TQM51331.1 thioredoxin-like protein [Arcticibacter tournemirensis]
MKRKIEVFTAGCPVCKPVVELVQSMACSNCEVEVYDLSKQTDPEFYTDKLKQYKVTVLPTVIVNGQKVDIAEGGITREQLSQAGVGQLI